MSDKILLTDCKLPIDEPYKCKKCPFKTHFQVVQQRHSCGEVGQRHLLCYICDECDFWSYSRWLYVLYHRRCMEKNSKRKCSDMFLCGYKCVDCGFTSNLKIQKKQHICGSSQCPIQTKIFTCRDCNFSTFSHMFWFVHVQNCAKTYKLSCDLCSYRTNRKPNMYGHVLAIHTPNDEIEWFQCLYCPHKTKYKSSLKRHTLFTHLLNENFHRLQCIECLTDKERKAHMIEILKSKHLSSSHDKVQWFQCKQCCYKTAQKNLFKHHMLSRHTSNEDVKWHKCELCSYKTKYKCSLNRHQMFKHATVNTPSVKLKETISFHCVHCDYKTAKRNLFRAHLLSKHTPQDERMRFKCDQCLYVATRGNLLRRHFVTKHTPLEDINWFQCQQCSYKCKQKESLKRHELFKHTPMEKIKWFECQVCNFKAKLKSKLNHHVKLKHLQRDITLYSCDYCDLNYKTGHGLKKHLLTKHSEDRTSLKTT